ncbi:MAG: ABC transporter ATP-binding protein [Nakamurella sp.]
MTFSTDHAPVLSEGQLPRSAGNAADAADSANPAGSVVAVDGVTRRYRQVIALNDVTCHIRRDVITGLLGRNGSGKTTLLRIIAGQEFPTDGSVTVCGATPAENPAVAHRLAFIREDQCYPDIQVQQALSIASYAFSNWDHDFAMRLVTDFELPLKRKIRKLSRGMRSALGIVIGLASRAELTMFDEPIAGLDPVARQMFYDHLLADYATHPRTFVISTHLIDEIAGLLEDVLLMSRGGIAMEASADELRGSIVTVTGPRAAVETFAAERGQWHVDAIGGHARATIQRPLTDADHAAAKTLGLTVEPITLQQFLVQLDGANGAPTFEAEQEVSR